MMLLGTVMSDAASSQSASSVDGLPIHANENTTIDTLSTTISVLEQRLAANGMNWAEIWDQEPTTMEDDVQATVDGSVSSPAGLVDDERTAHDTQDGLAKDLEDGLASPEVETGNNEGPDAEYVTSTVVFKKPQRPVLFLQTMFQPPSLNPCAFPSSFDQVSSSISSTTVPALAVKPQWKRRSHAPSAMRVTNMNTNSPTPLSRSSTMTYIEIVQPPRLPSSPATAVKKPVKAASADSRYGNLKTRAAERLSKLAVQWRARGRVRSTEVEKSGSWRIE